MSYAMYFLFLGHVRSTEESVAALIGKKLLTPDKLEGIVDEKDALLGAECMQVQLVMLVYNS